MIKSWGIVNMLVLAAISTARATCDDLDNYLNVPSPLTEDTTITLTVETIECAMMEIADDPKNDELEQVVVEGATLIIASNSTVQFINVAFLVESGGALVFDMPGTTFGPNDESSGDYPTGTLIEVSDSASLTFNGNATVQGTRNVESILENLGTTEFKQTVVIKNSIGGVSKNTGTLMFDGDTTIEYNHYRGLVNSGGGVVSFSADVLFQGNGWNYHGLEGCDIENLGSASEISFEGIATFQNTKCDSSEGVPVYNTGIMTFNEKARFNYNDAWNNGGAVRNKRGSMTFARAVQFIDNDSAEYGGGIAVDGGNVTFSKAVKFRGNNARSGGAFAVLESYLYKSGVKYDYSYGSLIFETPSEVAFVDNTVDTNDGENCSVGQVDEGCTLIGFPDDDVCVAASLSVVGNTSGVVSSASP